LASSALVLSGLVVIESESQSIPKSGAYEFPRIA
jgi:hypothetical protein